MGWRGRGGNKVKWIVQKRLCWDAGHTDTPRVIEPPGVFRLGVS